ncbi:MAG: hypothetical protein P1P84_02495 [Deferrisomatales bacterium]|nr:hypothetical protein [Deferrisomatales bacterium]
MKHTPGPWRIQHTPLSVAAGTHQIAQVFSGRPISTEDDANARLIAAAPELLEAAERALALIRDTWIMEHGNPQVGKAWGALEAAIDKATQDNPVA